MARKRLRRRFLIIGIVSVITMVIALAITVALGVYYTDHVVRAVYLHRLQSEDPVDREKGVMYVQRHAGQDPALDAALRDILKTDDETLFYAVVRGLAGAGEWGPQYGEPWLRYAKRLIESDQPARRLDAAVQLGRLTYEGGRLADHPRTAELIGELLIDDDADVRFNALLAAANLPPDAVAPLLTRATRDREPLIARHAWIIRGLRRLGEADRDWPALIADARPAVAPAIVYAGRRLGADLPAPAPPTDPPPDASDAVKQLAHLESLPTSGAMIEINDEMPDLIRLQAVRASATATPRDLMWVFESEIAAVRDLACVIAFERFDPSQVRELADALLRSFNRRQRMAGGILAGMLQPDEERVELMKLRLDRDRDWLVRVHMRLGLAMLDRAEPGFVHVATGLLTRDDVPRTTIIMALLHMGRLDGTDYLLDPFAPAPVELTMVFDQLRFGPVLRRYLPPLPEFRVWADRDRQRFQIDVIRDWYLLHRHDLAFDDATHVFRTLDDHGE